MLFRISVILLLFTGGFANSVKSEGILKVGLLAKDRPPFYMQLNQTEQLQGIYIELLEAAFKGTNFSLEFHRLPQTRLRLMMEVGALDLEPGIDKRWRTRPLEISNSVYSAPFMEDTEILLFSKESFREAYTKDYMNSLVFCGVRGYALPQVLQQYLSDESQKQNRILVLDEMQAIEMVNAGRCDYTVMSKILFQFLGLQNNHHVKPHMEPVGQFQLRFRLNKKFEYLLSEINLNLARLKETNELQRILKHYE